MGDRDSVKAPKPDAQLSQQQLAAIKIAAEKAFREKQTAIENFPDPQKYFSEYAPFQYVKIVDAKYIDLENIEYFDGKIDLHCLHCAKDSLFEAIDTNRKRPSDRCCPVPFDDNDRLESLDRAAIWDLTRGRSFYNTFKCSRCSIQEAHFLSTVKGTTLFKGGQSPSIYDLSKSKSNVYRSVLAKKDFSELLKAEMFAAGGHGIPAFTYLRRIFESLIEEARVLASEQNDWDEQSYKRSPMKERIGMLAEYLPSFLVEHSDIYSIMSLGIHELEEQVCLSAYPGIKLGIELILEEKVLEKRRRAKIKNFNDQKQATLKRLNDRNAIAET